MSRYVAESKTTDAGCFGYVDLCQLCTKLIRQVAGLIRQAAGLIRQAAGLIRQVALCNVHIFLCYMGQYYAHIFSIINTTTVPVCASPNVYSIIMVDMYIMYTITYNNDLRNGNEQNVIYDEGQL